MHLNRLQQASGFLIRMAALGGRFVFVFLAGLWMEPNQFGVYGLSAATAAIVVQIVGLEAYQVSLRKVARSDVDSNSHGERAHYGRFVIMASSIAAIGGALASHALGMTPWVIALTSLVCLTEYVGTETTRMLVVEKRADLAMYSIAIRFIPWNFGLPLGYLLGLWSNDWNAHSILLCWALSGVAGTMVVLKIAPLYRPRGESDFGPWLTKIFRAMPSWMVVALSYRFLESGVRLVPGFFLSEAVAGRFIFLSMLATVGATAMKAAVEPFFFVQLIKPETEETARKRFRLIAIATLVLAAIGSTLAMFMADHYFKYAITQVEWLTFGVMLAGYAALVFSQIPHFFLYSRNLDRQITRSSICSLFSTLVATCALTALYGILGTAIGTASGAAIQLATKEYFSIRARRYGTVGLVDRA